MGYSLWLKHNQQTKNTKDDNKVATAAPQIPHSGTNSQFPITLVAAARTVTQSCQRVFLAMAMPGEKIYICDNKSAGANNPTKADPYRNCGVAKNRTNSRENSDKNRQPSKATA